ncbi:MAG TPA: SDR family oxidoreductase [Alcanivoracaceae bacterium]|nr:SDR family oxidoreductase [Alcanivoracaceae bacterium]
MAYSWKKGVPKTVFITGGGSGLGREFARLLAKEGASIAIFNRRLAPDVILELEQAAQDSKQRFVNYSADVANNAEIQDAVARAVQELGAPDLVINSAGTAIAAPFEELEEASFRQVVEVNLMGSRNVAAAVLPHLSKGAHLVFVASIAGLLPNFAYAAYCASKYGTVGLAEVLRLELKTKGIDVSVCCPAEIDTPLVREERKTLHPVSGAMKDFVGTLEVEPACHSMLKAIAKRHFEIIPGTMPKLSAQLQQHLPAVSRKISDQLVVHHMRKYNENK